MSRIAPEGSAYVFTEMNTEGMSEDDLFTLNVAADALIAAGVDCEVEIAERINAVPMVPGMTAAALLTALRNQAAS